MWDSPLYAVNMFYYNWLIKKLLWPMAGQNKARQKIQTEIYKESRQSQGDTMLVAEGQRCEHLAQ